MLNVSTNTLKILAAVVWMIGAVILILKSGSLFFTAETIKPESNLILLGIILGLVIGGLKSRFLMTNFCRKNLIRINKLEEPKIYQFFTPGFFAALALMIIAGVLLSNLSQNNFSAALAVAIVDLTIGTGLLTSSRVFFNFGKNI